MYAWIGYISTSAVPCPLKLSENHPVPYEVFWHMDTTNCNLSKIGSKIIAVRFFETWNHILKAFIALKPEGDEKSKPRNSINIDQLCLTSTRHFWKMYRKWKFPNFQIYGFYDFFFTSKAWNLPNTINILFFVLYDITYIQNTGTSNNYLNLPINKNIMRYFFFEEYMCTFRKVIPTTLRRDIGR